MLRGRMTEILFIKTSSLGDVVHQMPAITDAARANPGVRLTWVVEEAFAPLARLHPAISEVVPVATRRWRKNLLQGATWREIAAFRSRLRGRRYDRVIDTQGLLRSALIAMGVRGQTHGYDAKSIREPLASYVYDVRHRVPRDRHAIARNRRLTSLALGYDLPDDLDYGLASQSPADPRVAVLLHGTSRASKEWPVENWMALGEALHRGGYGIVLPSGSAQEQARSARLASRLSGSRPLDRQPLDVVAATIAGASLVVGVDTGLLHLAAAYQVPLVAIFTATDPALTGPVGQGPMAVLGGKGRNPSVVDVVAAAEGLSP